MRTKDEKNEQRQRELILDAAWSLFREKGYENVTMEDILERASCSKGRFYYYFHAKAELLDTLYEVFDRQYEEIYRSLEPGLDTRGKLLGIHGSILRFMEREIGVDLLTQLYLSQLQKKTDIDFWGNDRVYPSILREIVTEGQRAGELRADLDAGEIAEDLVEMERRMLIDWCLKAGKTPLVSVGERRMALHLLCYAKDNEGR